MLLDFSAGLPIRDAANRVERFLSYHHDLSGGEWAQALLHFQAHPGPYPVEIRSPLDYYLSSSAAVQFRLLVEYAAQFPVNPMWQAGEYLCNTYGLDDEDMQSMSDFLAGQEAAWLNE